MIGCFVLKGLFFFLNSSISFGQIAFVILVIVGGDEMARTFTSLYFEYF
jgi:hypothetical protein